jgi:cell division protein FtsA
VSGPNDERGEDRAGPVARGADESNRIPRADQIGVITGELDQLVSDVGRALETMGYSGRQGRQVVLTGGGAELSGLADYTQAALGKPVRIGRPPQLRGLPEAHAVPGFATLAGLVLYAAEDPIDIRSVGSRFQTSHRSPGFAQIARLWTAMKEYF